MEYTAKVTREHDITAQQICDLVVTAFEGGSNYWIEAADLAYPTRSDEVWQKRAKLESPWYASRDLYELPRWTIRITVSEEDEPAERFRELTRERVTIGLNILGTEYHDHLLEILEDNADADTADAFLQCALFGGIVFG